MEPKPEVASVGAGVVVAAAEEAAAGLEFSIEPRTVSEQFWWHMLRQVLGHESPV